MTTQNFRTTLNYVDRAYARGRRAGIVDALLYVGALVGIVAFFAFYFWSAA